ncbi:hypothetical protein H6F86_17460 [Phormidium sp. FACHB-592]|uniref:hypothetical protein n=1 Tax=Phormidium sp. FACHB-592 TaxID=2692850 RepID=UPI0016871865|nr:hypothetical protein [Phormidium sp. FACHB-592]MBD2075648.1 hypothetical protein [Phormidium sp. FACHB-592]
MFVSNSEDGTFRLQGSSIGKCLEALAVDRPYQAMNLSGVTKTNAQKKTWRVLGTIERSMQVVTN